MSRHDYRVRVVVEFDIDVGASGRIDALINAEAITENVFRESFSRAKAVCIDTREVKELTPYKAGSHDH